MGLYSRINGLVTSTINFAKDSAAFLGQDSQVDNIKGADFTIQPQQSTHPTDQGGGNVIIQLQVPTGAGAEAFLRVLRGAANAFQVGPLSSGENLAWLGTAAPSTTNYTFGAGPTLTVTNVPTGGAINQAINGATVVQLTAALYYPITDNQIAFGASGNRWSDLETYTASFKGAIDLNSSQTIALGTGGTQTVPASPTPGLIVTSGTFSSNGTIDFTTNASNGFYVLDMSGVTLGATFGVVFKNGTATKTYTSSSVLSGSLALVWTHGANTLAVNF